MDDQNAFYDFLIRIGVTRKESIDVASNNTYNGVLQSSMNWFFSQDNLLSSEPFFRDYLWARVCHLVNYMKQNKLTSFDRLTNSHIEESFATEKIPTNELLLWYQSVPVPVPKGQNSVPSDTIFEISSRLGITTISDLIKKRDRLLDFPGIPMNQTKQIYNCAQKLGDNPQQPLENGMDARNYLKMEMVAFLGRLGLNSSEQDYISSWFEFNTYWSLVDVYDDFRNNRFPGLSTESSQHIVGAIDEMKMQTHVLEADRIRLYIP